MKLVAVVRVSQEAQATEGYGPAAQRKHIDDYAARIGASVIEVIEDRVSGTVPIRNRAGGKQLYEYIDSKRQCDGVLFARIDRVGRDEDGIEILQLRRDLRNANLELHFADRGKADLSGIGGVPDFFYAISAGDERKKIIKRTMDGKLAGVRDGSTMVGTHAPFGYRKMMTPRGAGKRRREWLEIDPKQAKFVRKMFAWVIEGHSLNEITRRLAGVPTQRGARYWERATVHEIVTNETYTGTWYYNKIRKIIPQPRGSGKIIQYVKPRSEWLSVPVPQIVGQEIFDRAQRQLEINKHNTRPPTRTYLLRGMCRCSACGRNMVGKAHKTGAAYVCGDKNRATKPTKCNTPQFSVRIIDAGVWEWVSQLLVKPDDFEQLIAQQNTVGESQDADRLAEIDEAIGGLSSDLLRWQRMLGSGRTDEDTFDAEVGPIRAQISQLEREKEAIAQRESVQRGAVQTIAKIAPDGALARRKLAEATNDTKRTIITQLQLSFVFRRDDTDYIVSVHAPYFAQPAEFRIPRP